MDTYPAILAIRPSKTLTVHTTRRLNKKAFKVNNFKGF